MQQCCNIFKGFEKNKSIFIWYFRWKSRFCGCNGSRTTDRELLNLWKHRHAFVYSQEIPVELFAVAKGHYIRHRLVRFLIKDEYPMYRYSALYQYINYRLIKYIFYLLFILDVYSLETMILLISCVSLLNRFLATSRYTARYRCTIDWNVIPLVPQETPVCIAVYQSELNCA